MTDELRKAADELAEAVEARNRGDWLSVSVERKLQSLVDAYRATAKKEDERNADPS